MCHMKTDSAPHAPDGAGCAACGRMTPDEARRCLMKPLPAEMGNVLRANTSGGQIPQYFCQT
jgi:hypothetical protein